MVKHLANKIDSCASGVLVLGVLVLVGIVCVTACLILRIDASELYPLVGALIAGLLTLINPRGTE